MDKVRLRAYAGPMRRASCGCVFQIVVPRLISGDGIFVMEPHTVMVSTCAEEGHLGPALEVGASVLDGRFPTPELLEEMVARFDERES